VAQAVSAVRTEKVQIGMEEDAVQEALEKY